MKNRGLCSVLSVLAWLVGIAATSQGSQQPRAFQPLTVYYVRHAESGHNVVKHWKLVPTALRPAYVGNEDAFSPAGEKQVATLTCELRTMKFDFIAASPTWRTRNTILPYLKACGQKAEIWPELTETPSVHTQWLRADVRLPPPSPKLFDGEIAIRVPEDEQPFFTLRKGGSRLLDLYNSDEAGRTANSLALAQKTIALIRDRYSQSGKTILLVGHGNSGSTLLRELIASELDKPHLDNIGMWMAEEQSNGRFQLKLLNNRPYVN